MLPLYDRRSGSSALMPRLAIYSILAGTWYLPNITGISGEVRPQNGKGRLLENLVQVMAV
jgi:hypothetical protein